MIQLYTLGNICQLNLYIGIGYNLPTIGGYMSIGGSLCRGPICRVQFDIYLAVANISNTTF